MLINMQLSILLSAARLQRNLGGRRRDENTEADALTNGIYDGFDLDDCISFSYSDLPLSLVHELWETKQGFDAAKMASTPAKPSGHPTGSKKFDKSPW